MVGLVGGEEAWDLGGIVLAVGVEGHDRHGATLERVAEAGAQRGTLAGVGTLREDRRTRRLGRGRRVVGRAIVHDDDRQEGPRTLHDGGDARAFLVAGDQGEDRLHARTVATLGGQGDGEGLAARGWNLIDATIRSCSARSAADAFGRYIASITWRVPSTSRM